MIFKFPATREIVYVPRVTYNQRQFYCQNAIRDVKVNMNEQICLKFL